MAKGENEVIYDQYSSNTFVKVKAAWDLRKILFSFVNKASENKENIDCYMRTGKVMALVEDFDNGEIDRKISTSIKKQEENKEQYAEPVWYSTYGGRETKEGKCFSRYFTIAPGMKTRSGKYNYAVLTAIEIPAIKNEMGGYEPQKGAKATTTIRVPFAQREDFREMMIELKYALKNFYSWRYSYQNTLSKYQAQNQSNPVSDNPGTTPSANDAPSKNSTASESEVSKGEENSETVVLAVKSKTPVTERKNSKGDFSMQVHDSNGKTLNLVISKGTIEKINKNIWSKFVIQCSKTAEKPVEFKMKCRKGQEKGRTVYYMLQFVKE